MYDHLPIRVHYTPSSWILFRVSFCCSCTLSNIPGIECLNNAMLNAKTYRIDLIDSSCIREDRTNAFSNIRRTVACTRISIYVFEFFNLYFFQKKKRKRYIKKKSLCTDMITTINIYRYICIESRHLSRRATWCTMWNKVNRVFVAD